MSDPERVSEALQLAHRLHEVMPREAEALGIDDPSGTLDVPHEQCEGIGPYVNGDEALDLEIEALRRGVPRVTHRHLRGDRSFMELAWGPLERCVWR